MRVLPRDAENRVDGLAAQPEQVCDLHDGQPVSSRGVDGRVGVPADVAQEHLRLFATYPDSTELRSVV